MPPSLAAAGVPPLVEAWALDAGLARLSPGYVQNLRFIAGKLAWWLAREGLARCGPAELRAFFSYVQSAHGLPEGRWGERGETAESHRARGGRGCPVSARYRPVGAGTLRDYHRLLSVLFAWAVRQGELRASPLEPVRRALARRAECRFHVFGADEARRVVAAAQRSRFPERDYALVLFLLDTGVRASELCALLWRDVDEGERRATVQGKGGKPRTVFWSEPTARALREHAAAVGARPATERALPVFRSAGGPSAGGALTRHGLRSVLAVIGREAGVAHCHPHTLRHTFATQFLLAGGNQMTLMDLMGHTTLAMTRRYVRFTAADLRGQAARFSPVVALGERGGDSGDAD